MYVYILLTFLTFVFVLYVFLKRRLQYWKNKNVTYVQPNFVFGNYEEYIKLKKYNSIVAQELCERFPKEPYIGTYYGTEPALLVKDPDLIKLITTKDFFYFNHREVSKYTHKEVFTTNMFFTYGDRWKVLRQNFSPLFSSSKMKNMFHLIVKCSRTFERLLENETKKNDVLEIRSLMARYTMDCVGSCAFGVDTNVMGDNIENNVFRKMGDLIFAPSNTMGLSLIARAMWPSIFYGLGMKIFSRDLDKFFYGLITDVFKARNYESSGRNDFVDLLLNLKKNEYIYGDSMSSMKSVNGKKISIEVDDTLLVGQCESFFAAGFETSATTLTFTLFELAKNKEAQDVAAIEVKNYLQKHKGLTYECISELPYLEACIDEALRLYPVLGLLTRELAADYTLPSGLTLEKGIRVHIPIQYIQMDPENFPEPEKYRPERFLPENKNNIKPYTYIPFGEGPRICIGMRFAKMQMLSGLVTLLNSYRVELAPGMPHHVTFEPRSITTQPVEKIFIKLERREQPLGVL